MFLWNRVHNDRTDTSWGYSVMTENLSSEVMYTVDGDYFLKSAQFDSYDLQVITHLFEKFVQENGLSDKEVTIFGIYLHHDTKIIVDEESI